MAIFLFWNADSGSKEKIIGEEKDQEKNYTNWDTLASWLWQCRWSKEDKCESHLRGGVGRFIPDQRLAVNRGERTQFGSQGKW